ncbi:hypothetical protein psal_cds_888 [Pandoravirus salinus]|uniref:Uncharacterized protein n=1 Tax=Pandoravirus salinus TaxID=1349410 RepID=S4VWG9_9VIRU|nr:hypothetical protein psal_cds_888 [Pandoravirus salinus]AGO84974.1 hypothetical protein psal_cds_888 [Pandoravirus salinus]
MEDAVCLGDLPDELLAAIVEDNHGGRTRSAERPLSDRDVFALSASDRRLAAAASRVHLAARQRAALTRQRTLLLKALCAAAADGKVTYVYMGQAIHGSVPTYTGLHFTLHRQGSPPSVYWTLRGDPVGDAPSVLSDVIGATGAWPRLDDGDFVDRLFDTWLALASDLSCDTRAQHIVVRPATPGAPPSETHRRLCALFGCGSAWPTGPIGLVSALMRDVWARWCGGTSLDAV